MTFNNRIDIAGINKSIVTNVEVTDSCYYLCGTLVDSVESGSFFAKLNLNGELEFFKKIGTDSLIFELVTPTLIQKNGSFYIAGHGRKSNKRETILLKMNTYGDVQDYSWLGFPGDYFGNPSPLSLVPLNNDWLLVERIVNHNRNRFEGRFLRLDSTGNIIWEKLYADPTYSFLPTDIIADSTGFVIGAGKGDIHYRFNNYHEQTVVLKYNHAGELQWKYESKPDSLWSAAESIIFTNDGGQIIGAKRGIPLQVNLVIQVFQIEHLLFKLDKNQNVSWSRLMRNEFRNEFNDIDKIIDTGDGVAYCGELIDENVGFQGIIGKVGYDGDSLWMRNFTFLTDTDTAYQNWLYDFEKTLDNGFIAVGYTTIDDKPDKLKYGWMLKVDEYGCLIPGCQLSNTKDISGETELDLSIFPNPTSEYLNFLVKDSNLSQLSYRIVTTEGKVISQNLDIKPNITYIVPVQKWISGT
ncbi:MAG: hypothetical protein KDC24_09950, partial [Saprospiraceae bacterium]|nr:hypothetical protein [Saprospiraceae bacterium]